MAAVMMASRRVLMTSCLWFACFPGDVAGLIAAPLLRPRIDVRGRCLGPRALVCVLAGSPGPVPKTHSPKLSRPKLDEFWSVFGPCACVCEPHETRCMCRIAPHTPHSVFFRVPLPFC